MFVLYKLMRYHCICNLHCTPWYYSWA